MEIFLRNMKDWSVTDIEFSSNLTAAQVLAALSFLGTNEFLNMRDVCVRACAFRPTTASLACSHWACSINMLTNFLHHTELPVSFFPIVDTCLNCEDIARQSCAMAPRWRIFGDFLRPVFSASCMQQVSDLHPKFALRPHHVCKYGRHPICDGWD